MLSGEIQRSKSIRIISLTIGRHFHLASIPREISMKYCAQSRNMNCDRGISDSLALCSRICPWISTYMHPLYLKDRDWKVWKKKIKYHFEEKDFCKYHEDTIFNICFMRAVHIARIKYIFKSTFAKRTLVSHKGNT